MSVILLPRRKEMPRKLRKRHFDLHRLLVKAKVLMIDLAATVVFFVWLYRVLMHELGVR
jgi:hypothetical protein